MKKKTGKIVGMLVVTVVLFIVLLFVQRIVTNGTEQKEVIVAQTDLSEGTVIDEKNAHEYLTFTKVDAQIVPESSLLRKEDVMNKRIVRTIRKNELLTSSSVCDSNYDTGKYPRATTVSFQLSSIAYGLAGKVRSGNLVNINAIDKETSKDREIVKDAYVSKVYDAEGKEIANTDITTSATIIEVIIDKSNLADLNEAIAVGNLVVSSSKGMIEKGE